MKTFDKDDSAYRTWIRANPSGYVVNSRNPPEPRYVKLHRVSCPSINRRLPADQSPTKHYLKICSTDPSRLIRWARKKAGKAPGPCKHCRQ
jgi:hypothetical protein